MAEQERQETYDEAVESFNQRLFDPYTPELADSLLNVSKAALGGGIEATKLFGDLTDMAQRALDKAKKAKDKEGIASLNDLHRGYKAAFDRLNRVPGTATPRPTTKQAAG